VFQNPIELGPYTILAFVLAVGAILYIKSFYGVHNLARRIDIPNHFKPALGGLCTGIIGFFLPQTLAFGYGYAQMALENQLPVLFLIGLALGKIMTTSFSIGSGGSGGVFGPSIVIGGAVGKVFHDLIPSVVAHPGSFVVVGMAGFFTAVSNAPISTIIFISEMTNSYHLLLPSLLVCSVTFLITRPWTIYVKQVHTRVDSPAHRGDFFVDILGTIRVKDLMSSIREVQLIPEDMTLNTFKKVFSSTDQHYFPVVDKENRLTGIFSINDVRSFLFEHEIGDLVVMKDIARSDIIYTTPSEDLNEVLKKFTIRNLQRIPVVSDGDPTRLLGMLDRKEVIEYYNRTVNELKSSKAIIDVESEKEATTLKGIKVKDAMNPTPVSINENEEFKNIKELFYGSKYRSFPVINQDGELIGILSFSDFQGFISKGQDLRAKDLASKDVVTVTREDSLFVAINRLNIGDYALLPVVEDNNSRQLVGVISRRDILNAYQKRIMS
jgi:CIC family chloride channel protein